MESRVDETKEIKNSREPRDRRELCKNSRMDTRIDPRDSREPKEQIKAARDSREPRIEPIYPLTTDPPNKHHQQSFLSKNQSTPNLGENGQFASEAARRIYHTNTYQPYGK